MKFGADGRLYCTVYNQRNVTVLDRNSNVTDGPMLDAGWRAADQLCVLA